MEAVDGYFSSPQDGFTPGYRFGIDWETAPPEHLPGKDQTRTYLQEVKDKTESWLRSLEDPDLLSPETELP